MHAQGQLLDKIDKTNKKIEVNLKKGDNIVQSMRTWKGWFKGIVFGLDVKEAPIKKTEEQKFESDLPKQG